MNCKNVRVHKSSLALLTKVTRAEALNNKIHEIHCKRSLSTVNSEHTSTCSMQKIQSGQALTRHYNISSNTAHKQKPVAVTV